MLSKSVYLFGYISMPINTNQTSTIGDFLASKEHPRMVLKTRFHRGFRGTGVNNSLSVNERMSRLLVLVIRCQLSLKPSFGS